MSEPEKHIGTRRVGPLLFWRGYTSTPRPWPRVHYVEQIGWYLILETMVVGVQMRGRR